MNKNNAVFLAFFLVLFALNAFAGTDDWDCGSSNENCFFKYSMSCSEESGGTWELGYLGCSTWNDPNGACDAPTIRGSMTCCNDRSNSYGCEPICLSEPGIGSGGRLWNSVCNIDFSDGIQQGEESCIQDPDDLTGTWVPCCGGSDCANDNGWAAEPNGNGFRCFGPAFCDPTTYSCNYLFEKRNAECCIDDHCAKPAVQYYCSSNSCYYGGCQSGFADCDNDKAGNGCECNLSTSHCEGSSCVSGQAIQCSDGTWVGNCSTIAANKGKYCENQGGTGVLIDACGSPFNCGCPNGLVCDNASNQCGLYCADGTSLGSCSAVEGNEGAFCDSQGYWHQSYCYGPDLVIGTSDDCSCASGYYCSSSGECLQEGIAECSTDTDCVSGKWCNSGNCEWSDPNQIKCVESDGFALINGFPNPNHNNIFETANAIDRTGFYGDSCLDSSTVIEYSCNNLGQVESTQFSCPSGFECFNGACRDAVYTENYFTYYVNNGESTSSITAAYLGSGASQQLIDSFNSKINKGKTFSAGNVIEVPDLVEDFGEFNGETPPSKCLFAPSDAAAFTQLVSNAVQFNEKILCLHDLVEEKWIALAIDSTVYANIQEDSFNWDQKGVSLYFSELTPDSFKHATVFPSDSTQYDLGWNSVNEILARNSALESSPSLNARILAHLLAPLDKRIAVQENQGFASRNEVNSLIEQFALQNSTFASLIDNPAPFSLVSGSNDPVLSSPQSQTVSRNDLTDFLEFAENNGFLDAFKPLTYSTLVLLFLKQNKISQYNSWQLIRLMYEQDQSINGFEQKIMDLLSATKPEFGTTYVKMKYAFSIMPYKGMYYEEFKDKFSIPFPIKSVWRSFLQWRSIVQITDLLGKTHFYADLYGNLETALENEKKVRAETIAVGRELFKEGFPATNQEFIDRLNTAANARGGRFVSPVLNFYKSALTRAETSTEYNIDAETTDLVAMAQEYEALKMYYEAALAYEEVANRVFDFYYPVDSKSDAIKRLELAEQDYYFYDVVHKDFVLPQPYFNLHNKNALIDAINKIEKNGNAVYYAGEIGHYPVPRKYFSSEMVLTEKDLPYLYRRLFRLADKADGIIGRTSKLDLLYRIGVDTPLTQRADAAAQWLSTHRWKEVKQDLATFFGVEDLALMGFSIGKFGIKGLKAVRLAQALRAGDLTRLGFSVDEVIGSLKFLGRFNKQYKEYKLILKVGDEGETLVGLGREGEAIVDFVKASEVKNIDEIAKAMAKEEPNLAGVIEGDFYTETGTHLVFNLSHIKHPIEAEALVAEILSALPAEIAQNPTRLNKITLFVELFSDGKQYSKALHYYNPITGELEISLAAADLRKPRTLTTALLEGIGLSAEKSLSVAEKVELMTRYETIYKKGEFFGERGLCSGFKLCEEIAASSFYQSPWTLDGVIDLSKGFERFYSASFANKVLKPRAFAKFIESISDPEVKAAYQAINNHLGSRLGLIDNIGILNAETKIKTAYWLEMKSLAELAENIASVSGKQTTKNLFKEITGQTPEEISKGVISIPFTGPRVIERAAAAGLIVIPSIYEATGLEPLSETIPFNEFTLPYGLNDEQANALLAKSKEEAEEFDVIPRGIEGNGYGWRKIIDNDYLEISENPAHQYYQVIVNGGFQDIGPNGLKARIREALSVPDSVYSQGFNTVYEKNTSTPSVKFKVIVNSGKEVIDAFLEDSTENRI